MKTITFLIIKSTLIAFIIGSVTGCEEEVSPIECNDTGVELNFTGRIYANNPFNNDFYIGPLDNRNGGQIPCGGLPDAFQKEGIVVDVEGITAGSPPDTDDPLYGYLIIKSIKENN